MPSRWAGARGHLAHWQADRAAHGVRHATVHRLRAVLDLEPVTAGRVDQMSDQIKLLVDLTNDLDDAGRANERAADASARELADLRERSRNALAAEEDSRRLFERVWTTTSWLDATPLTEDVLVTVVLPTRGVRLERLQQAVASVVGQRYSRWQLVVVVDEPGSAETVAAELPDDGRIEVVESPRPGVSAARNTGLDRARGDVIAYLDDDNVMLPLWLKGVAWASGRFPDADVFYGAEIIDVPSARLLPGTSPLLHLEPFDRRRLRDRNFLDQNAVAHRRSLAGAHYDESLTSHVDWDLLLRITADREPVMIPVVAASYRTDAPDRLTGSPESEITREVVRARADAMAPLRVLAVNAMYPLITETYVGEELDALAAMGADIACCVLERRVAPVPSPYPLFHDLHEAVREHEPDVLLLHWAGVGVVYRDLIQSVGLSYAVRGHSFAHEPDVIRTLVDDPRCIGVWAFPQHVSDDPKVHPLPTLFTSHERLLPTSGTRDLVLSCSAGLPKKDFPLLLEALSPLTEVERRIVVGTTAEHEHVVLDLVLALKEHEDPPIVQVNLDRTQVFELLRRASVVVYTLKPDMGFGMPMSVIEGMTAGACVVLPDFPVVREVFGPDVRTYRDAEDIRRHVRDVLAGGPGVDAERERLRSRALEQFCDPELGKRFYAELVDALHAATAAG